MNIATLLLAMAMVESSGNATAVGAHGEVGVLQIRECVVRDVNTRCKTRYRWPEDAMDPATAFKIAETYLMIYASGKSPEAMARIWNGGPRGATRAATRGYWAKVLRVLEDREQMALVRQRVGVGTRG